MDILAIDTALEHCSVAITRDGAELACLSQPMKRGHAEALAPMVSQALAFAKVDAKAINRVGVVVGPGSFAGVRVGLGFARAMAIGTSIEIVGITSLAALASSSDAPDGACRGVTIDARQGHLYAALYDNEGSVLKAPFIAKAQDAHKMLGNAAGKRSMHLVDGANAVIDPLRLCAMARAAPTPSNSPAPLYLRPPDAIAPSPGRYDGIDV